MRTADITIITPTYNRGELLERLYCSLQEQTCGDFEWLIVDDGSMDDTEQRVRTWQNENHLEVKYIRQENGGKHRALNKGIETIDSELTFIVDSDDFLPPDAIQIIMEYHKKYSGDRNRHKLCGYSFLRFYSSGEVNTAFFTQDEEIGTYLQIRINGDIGGDKAEVFYTSVLKGYPFPEYPEENFMPEDVVWMQMSDKYNMVHINRCVYISDYLEGGLTKSGRRMKLRSPKGMALRSKIYINNKNVKCKVKIKMMLLYHVYGRAAGYTRKELESGINNKLIFRLCLLPGRLIYHCWTG